MADKKRRVPSRPRPVRFSPGVEALIERAAHEQGISFAEFVREASSLCAMALIVEQAPWAHRDLAELLAEIREALREGRFDP